jgi:hypothetical protein
VAWNCRQDDTVSHQGLLGKEDAATFFASAGIPGIPKDQVLQDTMGHLQDGAADQLNERARVYRPDLRRGAAPGDMLEVRIHNLRLIELARSNGPVHLIAL